MKSFCLIIVCFFTLSSCNSLVKKINGEKKPKIESQETLRKFISENNLEVDLTKNMFLKNQQAAQKIITSKIGYVDQKGDLIAYGVYLFDKEWNVLKHDLLEGCLKDEIVSENFYENTIQANKSVESKFNLLELENSFIDYKGNDFFPFKKNQKSIAIVVWAKYKGKKWSIETEHLIQSLKTSKTGYEIYYLNLDPNKFYNHLSKNKPLKK